MRTTNWTKYAFMLRQLTSLLLMLTLIPVLTAQADEITVTDADVEGNVTWTADNIYFLDGFVFVEDGDTLTIEPGTVVKGKSGTGEDASALIIARGGTIDADGTATDPIIFTAEADDMSDPGDLPLDARGLWGGVILLGKSTVNEPGGEAHIEGIPETEPRGSYGGDDSEDSSGTLRYVSIRYGGSNIGAGNEINGLTFGGVGSGTIVEYVEVFNNQDDGFEWFGGTVNTRYLVSAFNGDDSFDYDQGFDGKGQFWFAVQPAATEQGDRAGEHDGGDTQEDAEPYATPEIYNVTYIGGGAANGGDDQTFVIRDNAGGHYANSIFTDFGNIGIEVEDLESGQDSRVRLENGDLTFTNNLWWDFGAGNAVADFAPQSPVQNYLSDTENSNWAEDPALRSISRANDGGLDPRPSEGSPALEAPRVKDVPSGGFFTETDYLGAFGSSIWASGWTFIDEVGYLIATEATAIEDGVAKELPRSIALEQNYPNPFNPSTNIRFELDKTQQVRLTVRDVLGRTVRVLADDVMPAGTHMTTFTASELPSGIYYYRLDAGAQSITNKMLLLK